MKKLNCAIIGCGNIARSHVQTLLESGCGEIVALVDTVEEKAVNFRKKYGLNAEIYTDYTKMLSECKIDVVHVCTPHYLHKEMIIAGLNRNINVLCEKPLCIKSDEISEIETALKSSAARLGVVQQNRYNESSIYLKEYLKDKKILSGYATLVWNRDEKYYSQDGWHGVLKKEGGGVVINQALHTLDLMQWFMGMPKRVCGKTEKFALKDKIEVEDTAVARFYTDDASFAIFATNTAELDFNVHLVFKLEGGEEVIMFPAAVLTNEGYKEFVENKPLGKDCYGSGHEKLIVDFYDCVINKRRFAVDFDEAKKVVKMIFALYESNGKSVDI